MVCKWCKDTKLYQPSVGPAVECLECKPRFEVKRIQKGEPGYYKMAVGPCCSKMSPDAMGVRLSCTREPGHPRPHAAHGSNQLATWED